MHEHELVDQEAEAHEAAEYKKRSADKALEERYLL